MKRIKKPFGIITAIILSLALVFGAAACQPGETPGEPVEIKVAVTAPQDTISAGETLQMTATVTGTENQTCLWSVSDPLVLKVSETGEVTVLKAPEIIDINVTVTATSVESSTARGTKTIRVLAPAHDGQVGLLTSEMIKAVNGDNITLSGTVTDIHMDTNMSDNSWEYGYDITVMMEENKWKGSWKAATSSFLMENIYSRGALENVYYTELSSDGTEKTKVGHSVEEQCITRNNTVVTKIVKDYLSYPVSWESRHYNNHLKSFQNLVKPSRVKYDPDNDKRYAISLNVDTFEEGMLAAYLAQSFTPMLNPNEEWFETVVFVLTDDGNAIKGIDAETRKVYTGAVYDKEGNLESYDTVSYSVVRLDISDVGTTSIAPIKAYDAPENADKLTAAINTMKSATSYKYTSVDHQTYAVMPDDGDYSVDAFDSAAPARNATGDGAPTANFNNNPYNYLSATGTVGQVGWVTSDAVVIATTSKYNSSTDGKDYKTEYTGYKQFDGYYERFGYYTKTVDGTTTKGLKGDRRYSGSLTDKLPAFDFSANIFKFVGETLDRSGKKLYTFTLRASDLTREIATQVNLYKYASNGAADSRNQLTAIVDDAGNLVSVEYPYDINGNYSGTIKTTYTSINSTAVDADKISDNYIARGKMDKWSDYEVIGYYYDESGNHYNTYNAEAAMQSVYGSSSVLPSPEIFQDVFGDSLFVHYNDDRVGGIPTKRVMDITASTEDVDENSHLNDYMAIYNKLTEKLVAAGFAVDHERTDISGGVDGKRDKVAIYVSSNIVIRFESNGTKNFWIYFYKSSDYNRE